MYALTQLLQAAANTFEVVLEYISAAKPPVKPLNTHSQHNSSPEELQGNTEESFPPFSTGQKMKNYQQQSCHTENTVGCHCLIPHLSKEVSDILVPAFFQPKV